MVRSMRFAWIVLVSLGLLALSTAAWAQPPGPGFGMFGGGPGASVSMQYGRLLNTPTVQKDLELVDDQKTKIKEAADKAQAAMREIFMGMRDLSQEERQAKMEEIGKKMQTQQDDLKKVIESTLLPNQLKRLKEIALQVAGVQALNDKQVQEDLKLTSEQVAKIKTIGEDSAKKIRDLFSEGADPRIDFPENPGDSPRFRKTAFGRAQRCTKSLAGKNEGPKAGNPRL